MQSVSYADSTSFIRPVTADAANEDSAIYAPYRDSDLHRVAHETKLRMSSAVGKSRLSSNTIVTSIHDPHYAQQLITNDPKKQSSVVIARRSVDAIRRDLNAVNSVSNKVRIATNSSDRRGSTLLKYNASS